jgi:hypothetical protein
MALMAVSANNRQTQPVGAKSDAGPAIKMGPWWSGEDVDHKSISETAGHDSCE